jgi:hypothetical protein
VSFTFRRILEADVPTIQPKRIRESFPVDTTYRILSLKRRNCLQFDVSIDSANAGRIIFKLYDEAVPNTARNFRELATGQHGFGYSSSHFHRIIPNVCIFTNLIGI